MNKELIMNPNQLVAFLEKPCAEFTKEDIKRYIQQNSIRMVNRIASVWSTLCIPPETDD